MTSLLCFTRILRDARKPLRRCVSDARKNAAIAAVTAFCFTLHTNSAGADSVNTASSDVRLIEAPLVNQDARNVNFVRDVVGDRIVVVTFIYTKCSTLCPLVSTIFDRLQDRLSSEPYGDVRLVSLTLDPIGDTPARLKEFSSHFRTSPNWLWLTGAAPDVKRVLAGFGVTTTNVKDHSPVTLIGDARTGRWTQLNDLPAPREILAEVDRLLAARKERK